MVQIKKKRSKQSKQEDDIPENLKTFIDSVTIKRELPIAAPLRRSRKAKNVEEEKEDLSLKITKPVWRCVYCVLTVVSCGCCRARP